MRKPWVGNGQTVKLAELSFMKDGKTLDALERYGTPSFLACRTCFPQRCPYNTTDEQSPENEKGRQLVSLVIRHATGAGVPRFSPLTVLNRLLPCRTLCRLSGPGLCGDITLGVSIY